MECLTVKMIAVPRRVPHFFSSPTCREKMVEYKDSLQLKKLLVALETTTKKINNKTSIISELFLNMQRVYI